MSAKNVRELKRSRQFALPKIPNQHSSRDNSTNESLPIRPQQKYLTITGDRHDEANRSHTLVKHSKLEVTKRKLKGSSVKQSLSRNKVSKLQPSSQSQAITSAPYNDADDQVIIHHTNTAENSIEANHIGTQQNVIHEKISIQQQNNDSAIASQEND